MLVAVVCAPTRSYALVVECPLCSKYAKQVEEWFTEKASLVKETISSNQNTITATQQTLATVNSNVIRPMNDAMNLVALANTLTKNANLVTQQGLLKQDPEQYLKTVGTQVVMANLANIQSSGGIYGSDVYKSVVARTRETSNPMTNLNRLTQSSIPSQIQDEVCDTGELEEYAKEEATDEDGNINDEDYEYYKELYYDSFCTGEPSQDKELAQRLTAVDGARGGNDLNRILSKTDCDNTYCRTERASNEIEKIKSQKIATAQKELDYGQGIAGPKICTQRSEPDTNGETYCLKEVSITRASDLSAAFQKNTTAEIDRLIATYGTGGTPSFLSGVFDLAKGVFGIAATGYGIYQNGSASLNKLEGAADNLGNNLDSFAGGSDAKIGSSGVQVASNGSLSGLLSSGTSGRTASYQKDLTAGSKAQTSMYSSVVDQMRTHLDSLTQLESLDNDYLSKISSNQSSLESMKACYEALTRDYGASRIIYLEGGGTTTVPGLFPSNDPRLTSALDYYNRQTNKNNSLQNTVNAEISTTIPQARAFIQQTKDAVANSLSSEEIYDLFNSYQTAISSKQLPVLTASSQREAEVMGYDSDTQMAREEGGIIFEFQKTCSTTRDDIIRQMSQSQTSF